MAALFFTVVRAGDVLRNVQIGFAGSSETHDVMQRIQTLMMPVAPEGYSTDIQQVEELDGQTVLKVVRSREAVDETMQLLAFDMITGSLWMDVRKAQDPTRTFGQAPTAAWTEFRRVLPLQRTGPDAPPAPTRSQPDATISYRFLKQHPASDFYPAGRAIPDEPQHRNANSSQ